MASAEVFTTDLCEGAVAWVAFDPIRGRGQGGRRPALIVSTDEYLDAVTTLAIVVPITSRDRGWSSHVAVTGLAGLREPSWAMTEQPRTISRERITHLVGVVDEDCLARVRVYLRDYLRT